MTEASAHVISLNQRISYADRRGTVRYIGSLESIGHSGLWVGVEWDEESTNYHDGMVKGQRFFRTSSNCASFLPIHKVDKGVSAKQAILEKYGGSVEDIEIAVRFGTKHVVAVGWEKVMKKVSHLEKLKHVDLTGLFVNDSEKDLASLIPNVETIALRQSLIGTWSSILMMIKNLPLLTTLDLGQNRLSVDTGDTNSFVKRLVLRGNMLTWNDVLQILLSFPALEEIFLPENQIATIESTDLEIISPRLFSIDLESQKCTFSDWNAVNQLGNLPKLKVLQLSGNHFREVHFSNPEDGQHIFPGLATLTFKLNQLTEWTSVNELNKLPALETLKLTQNPILETVTPQTARQWIIAKIANLKNLNQTAITASERRDAELDYLRHFGAEWLSLKPDDTKLRESFLKQHPRFPELLAKNGPLESGELSSHTPKHLKDTLIKVTLQCYEVKKEKSIPPSITVMKLKRLTERTFRIPEINRLVYSSPGKSDIEYVLDDDLKEIAHYDVKTGDTIIVS